MKSILKWVKSVKGKALEILELMTRPEDHLTFEDYNNYLGKHKKQVKKINKIKQGWE